ncbi:Transmembrane protein [Orchesella cincta]|uniref:Transmembrane protein n=1 Tax=Orchesella cincta TaxID=48709 RepID=A0A1D2MUF6_ORCCI|nr:Transmembrane protein [Orchesella cincta]
MEMRSESADGGVEGLSLNSLRELEMLSVSEKVNSQSEESEDCHGCSEDKSCSATRRRKRMDLSSEDLGLSGEARKSKRLFGYSPSSSCWNSLRLGMMLVIALSFVVVVSAKGEMIPEDDFDSSNKKVKFEDFDTNVTPVQPGGGTSSTKGPEKEARSVASLGFLHAFVASFSVIVVSELGDKTFFIAAIMAMRHSRLTVFAGAIAALGLMTVLSALFGYATTIIPKEITYYISTALFAIFGLKMLYDGYRMSPDEGQEELEEVQATLRRRDDDNNDIESQTSKEATPMVSEGYKLPTGIRRILFTLFSRIFLQAFTMTFLAEWGDRSQIATIILAAREDVPGVCIGGVLGHSCCTGLAVLGGRMVAAKISVRTVTIIGGIVFLLFAVTSLFMSAEISSMSDLLEWVRGGDGDVAFNYEEFEHFLATAYARSADNMMNEKIIQFPPRV